MTLSTVVFDVGETLWDETGLWASWAEWLGVPTLTLYGVLGGLIARGQAHDELLGIFRPGEDIEELRERKQRERPATLATDDLYPDAVPCLTELAGDGWRVVVCGNQPLWFQPLVEQLDLPVTLVSSSGELGFAKPDPAFFTALAERAGASPEDCVHVGDRVDNDIVPALAAGMTAVHVRRGPWGWLQAADLPAAAHQILDLNALPPLLRTIR